MGDSIVTRPAKNTEIPTTSSKWFNQKVEAVAEMLSFNQKVINLRFIEIAGG